MFHKTWLLALSFALLFVVAVPRTVRATEDQDPENPLLIAPGDSSNGGVVESVSNDFQSDYDWQLLTIYDIPGQTGTQTSTECPSGNVPMCVQCSATNCIQACYGGATCQVTRKIKNGHVTTQNCSIEYTCVTP